MLMENILAERSPSALEGAGTSAPAMRGFADHPVAAAQAHPALEHLRSRLINLGKDRLIYDEHDRPDAFYRLVSGCVRLQVTSEDGRRQILAFCLPGDIFGIQPGGAHISAAETTMSSVVQRFSMNTLLDEGFDRESLIDLVGAAADMSSTLSLHLRGLNRITAASRLVWFLDWLAGRLGTERKGGVLRPPMSRRDIADFVGLTPETLSRSFARLQDCGHLRFLPDRRLLLRPCQRALPAASGALSTAA